MESYDEKLKSLLSDDVVTLVWLNVLLPEELKLKVPFNSSKSKIFDKLGFNVSNLPLSAYRNLSFYTMRTDALDRFGTRLEQRFSREQIRLMMEESGLEQIVFSENEPFWCAVGYRSLNDRSN